MSTVVRNLTIVLGALSILAGAAIGPVLDVLEVQVPNRFELRWSLIVGMPIALFASFTWLNRQPAKDIPTVLLQSIGLMAVFLIPVWWVIRHAQ